MIVMKMGHYNHIHVTYDGRHGDCNNEAFRSYIENLQELAKTVKASGLDVDQVLNNDEISKNPFIKDDEIEDVAFDTYEKALQYLSKNASNWNYPIQSERGFKQLIERSQVLYYFEYIFTENNFFDPFSELSQKQYLGYDGRIHSGEREDLLDYILYCESMDEAVHILSELIEYVEKELISKGYELPVGKQVFSICFLKGKISPTHLFTKDEIRDEMRKADDRIANFLVIDCDGFAHVEHDIKKQNLYPVRCETWGARSNYVGKYSDLSDLDEVYLQALDGWLLYLRTGEQQYIDYIVINDDSEILEKIKKYYQ